MPPGDYRIEIANEQDRLEIDEPFLREVVAHALAAERVAQAEISLALVGDAAIHELNRRHLDHDEPTDVLSFPLETRRGPDGRVLAVEGELIVSAETAARRAAEFSWTPREELVLYIVHGLLHLAGHDDLTAAGRRLMRRRERAILGRWGLAPRYRRPQPTGSRERAAPTGGAPGAGL